MKITSLENRLIDLIDKHRHVLLLAIIFVLGAAIRWAGRYFISEDLENSLIPWFNTIKGNGGLAALSAQVGNYGLLYQTLISLMTYLPIPAVVQYKLLSCVFDVALALMAGKIYREERMRGVAGAPDAVDKALASKVRWQSWFFAALVWVLPTVMMNSSYWGQCDSMYGFFCLATLYTLRRGSFFKAFVFLGLAFSCKLQTVFIVPMIGVYYLISRRFSLVWVLLSVVVMWLTGIVAFGYGRSLLDPILIYTDQVGHYRQLYMNFPSMWMLVGDDYWSMRWFAILFTMIVLATGLWYCLNHKSTVLSRERYYTVAVWFMWSMLLFLPSMHDRYGYILDIILLMLGCLDSRYLKYAFVTIFLSLFTYGIYLFGDRGDGYAWEAAIYLVTYLHFTWTLVKDVEQAQLGR